MKRLLGRVALIFFILTIPSAYAGSAKILDSEFGEKWPLTVSKGTLSCEPLGNLGIITFSANGKTYAVNGIARGRAKQNNWRPIDEIWKPNPSVPGTKINISPLIDRGLSLCK